ncbi:hypothetical protein TNCV_5087651 [Trichonephila clavipes]|nr:hypothetical protein TNCV_5087651 [Trichonephila clavipes]
MNKYFSRTSSICKTCVLLQTERYCVLPVMTSGSLDLRYLPLPPENKENEKLILFHVNHRFVYLFCDGVDAPSGPRRRFPERDGGGNDVRLPGLIAKDSTSFHFVMIDEFYL